MPQQIGETRTALRERTLSKKLNEVAGETRQKHGWEEFWIVMFHKPDQLLYNVIREGVKVFNVDPRKSKRGRWPQVGSMCFHFDYPKSLIEAVWILPPDIGIFDCLPQEEKVSAIVGKSVANTSQLVGGSIL